MGLKPLIFNNKIYIPFLSDSEKEQEKLTLGIMPKWLYEEQRILELTRAIYEYVETGKLSENITSIEQWINELKERVNTYKGR